MEWMDGMLLAVVTRPFSFRTTFWRVKPSLYTGPGVEKVEIFLALVLNAPRLNGLSCLPRFAHCVLQQAHVARIFIGENLGILTPLPFHWVLLIIFRLKTQHWHGELRCSSANAFELQGKLQQTAKTDLIAGYEKQCLALLPSSHVPQVSPQPWTAVW